MYRVLRPGGRVAVSDIALKKPLPEELARSILAYVGCVAGAIPVGEYERGLREAGFDAVQVLDTHKDLNAYAQVEGQAGCCSPAASDSGGLPMAEACCGGSEATGIHRALADILARYNVNDYAASVQVYALKGA
jgi:hypothetical protein